MTRFDVFLIRFVASVVSCPADVVKTRMMNQRLSQGGTITYRSSLDCLVKTARTEGISGLYKGFLPTWARLGPWQFTFWVCYERLRIWTGVGSF
jgi:solute carrier family 25 uncoupling protein 27